MANQRHKHTTVDTCRVVVFAGGGGGARLVDGLARILPPHNLTVIANSGDDFVHLGLTICPDLDTVLYTLAGVINPETGWGRLGETWRAMDAVRTLGGPGWFSLGDADLGTHLTRTHLLAQGHSLTEVTAHLCEALGVTTRLLPVSDRVASTLIETPGGVLSFQEWFVRDRWQPEVKRVLLPDDARATPQAIRAVQQADIVILGPSNPYVSIDPILNAYPLRALVADLPDVVVAVSPIIAGDAVKGPTAKMMRAWGVPVTPQSVLLHYDGLLNGFVYDVQDEGTVPVVAELQMTAVDTWMRDVAGRERLARDVMSFALGLLKG